MSITKVGVANVKVTAVEERLNKKFDANNVKKFIAVARELKLLDDEHLIDIYASCFNIADAFGSGPCEYEIILLLYVMNKKRGEEESEEFLRSLTGFKCPAYVVDRIFTDAYQRVKEMSDILIKTAGKQDKKDEENDCLFLETTYKRILKVSNICNFLKIDDSCLRKQSKFDVCGLCLFFLDLDELDEEKIKAIFEIVMKYLHRIPKGNSMHPTMECLKFLFALHFSKISEYGFEHFLKCYSEDLEFFCGKESCISELLPSEHLFDSNYSSRMSSKELIDNYKSLFLRYSYFIKFFREAELYIQCDNLGQVRGLAFYRIFEKYGDENEVEQFLSFVNNKNELKCSYVEFSLLACLCENFESFSEFRECFHRNLEIYFRINNDVVFRSSEDFLNSLKNYKLTGYLWSFLDTCCVYNFAIKYDFAFNTKTYPYICYIHEFSKHYPILKEHCIKSIFELIFENKSEFDINCIKAMLMYAYYLYQNDNSIDVSSYCRSNYGFFLKDRFLLSGWMLSKFKSGLCYARFLTEEACFLKQIDEYIKRQFQNVSFVSNSNIYSFDQLLPNHLLIIYLYCNFEITSKEKLKKFYDFLERYEFSAIDYGIKFVQSVIILNERKLDISVVCKFFVLYCWYFIQVNKNANKNVFYFPKYDKNYENHNAAYLGVFKLEKISLDSYDEVMFFFLGIFYSIRHCIEEDKFIELIKLIEEKKYYILHQGMNFIATSLFGAEVIRNNHKIFEKYFGCLSKCFFEVLNTFKGDHVSKIEKFDHQSIECDCNNFSFLPYIQKKMHVAKKFYDFVTMFADKLVSNMNLDELRSRFFDRREDFSVELARNAVSRLFSSENLLVLKLTYELFANGICYDCFSSNTFFQIATQERRRIAESTLGIIVAVGCECYGEIYASEDRERLFLLKDRFFKFLSFTNRAFEYFSSDRAFLERKLIDVTKFLGCSIRQIKDDIGFSREADSRIKKLFEFARNA